MTEARPYEMENLVDDDEPKQARRGEQPGLEHNLALADETGRVNRGAVSEAGGKQLASMCDELRPGVNRNRIAAQLRQPEYDFADQRSRPAIDPEV